VRKEGERSKDEKEVKEERKGDNEEWMRNKYRQCDATQCSGGMW